MDVKDMENEPAEGWLDEPDTDCVELEPPEEAVLPSEVFESFLQFLETCRKEYQTNVQEAWKHERNRQDDYHDLELAETDEEAAALGIRIAQDCRERRWYKDIAQMYEYGAEFLAGPENRTCLQRLQALVGKQKQREDYLINERHYRRRGR